MLYLRDRMPGRCGPAPPSRSSRCTRSACFAKEHGIVLPAILAAAELTVIHDATPWRERVAPRCDRSISTLALAAVSMLARAVARARRSDARRVPAVHAVQQPAHQQSRSRADGARRRARAGCDCSSGPCTSRPSTGRRTSRSRRASASASFPGFALLVAILALGVAAAPPAAGDQLRHRVRMHRAASVEQLSPAGGHRARRAHAVSAERRRDAGPWRRRRRWLPIRSRARFASPGMAPRLGGATPALCSSPPRCTQHSAHHGVARQRSLFRQAVIDAPRVYRAHFMLGALDFEHKRKRDGEAEYRKALGPVSVRSVPGIRPGGAVSRRGPVRARRFRCIDGPRARSEASRSGTGYSLGACSTKGSYAEAKSEAFESIRVGAEIKDMRRVIVRRRFRRRPQRQRATDARRQSVPSGTSWQSARLRAKGTGPGRPARPGS